MLIWFMHSYCLYQFQKRTNFFGYLYVIIQTFGDFLPLLPPGINMLSDPTWIQMNLLTTCVWILLRPFPLISSHSKWLSQEHSVQCMSCIVWMNPYASYKHALKQVNEMCSGTYKWIPNFGFPLNISHIVNISVGG